MRVFLLKLCDVSLQRRLRIAGYKQQLHDTRMSPNRTEQARIWAMYDGEADSGDLGGAQADDGSETSGDD